MDWLAVIFASILAFLVEPVAIQRVFSALASVWSMHSVHDVAFAVAETLLPSHCLQSPGKYNSSFVL